jgi:hypothetical protein
LTSGRLEGLRRALLAGRPLVLVESGEEERALAVFRQLARELTPALPVWHWTCLAGLAGAGETTRDPAQALQAIVSHPRAGLYVFCDLDPFLARPDVQRGLKEAGRALANTKGACLLLSPRAALPATLAADIAVVRLGLPGVDELSAAIADVVGGGGCPVSRDEWVVALQGLPLREARFVLQGALRGHPDADRLTLLRAAFAEKARTLGADGVLRLVPPDRDLDDVGGLAALKAWLDERRGLLSADALRAALPTPRGMLLTGVSGCGKSFAVKAASATWGVPLFRLDLNLVFSGRHGAPEAAFQRALDTLEAAAPVVVWIDEIEDALGLVTKGGGYTHLFSAFLTWLQERPPLIFVAATANKIDALPAELLRKGRFDEVFFVDLPTAEERGQILRVHLRRQGLDARSLSLAHLVADTRGWTGAEIEAAICSARVTADRAGRSVRQEDLDLVTDGSVPLSRSMHEQIRRTREWAHGRARRASAGVPPRTGVLTALAETRSSA